MGRADVRISDRCKMIAQIMGIKNKIFVCTDHNGHWPVGAASVIVAPNIKQARILLDAALIAHSLKSNIDHPFTLQQINLSESAAHILCDGDY